MASLVSQPASQMEPIRGPGRALARPASARLRSGRRDNGTSDGQVVAGRLCRAGSGLSRTELARAGATLNWSSTYGPGVH